MALSTPPAIPAGTLATRPQPVLPAAGGLFLRPWEACDAAVFFAAYADPEIRHWHTRQPASETQVHEWFDQYRQAWARETGARGAGVASRALTGLSAWALGEAGFHRLHLDHSTRNLASCRVAAKAGFLLEGTKRSDAVHSDGRHDMHLHARIRGDEQLA